MGLESFHDRVEAISVHLVHLFFPVCLVQRTREARQTRAPDRLPGIVAHSPVSYYAALLHGSRCRASATARGLRAATRRSARAGPSGVRRPCSQLRRVATLMPIMRVKQKRGRESSMQGRSGFRPRIRDLQPYISQRAACLFVSSLLVCCFSLSRSLHDWTLRSVRNNIATQSPFFHL